ncbi:helix-turn-helix domain-containing protein [Wohlfahrtiimonas larvae]|uniref:Transcriptional regulator n=1 Tax=Wohlfahrtiimonas larvae TaxID=1157986 RepID=A0ABP9MYP1_9GAMM|nr:helix-turn-helix domain-containing protein [Wohlfahrtiimonas larvae]
MIIHANHCSVQDMHPEDIKAAIKKAGFTMTSLAKMHGIKYGSTLNQVFHNPNYPKAERIISDAIGLSVEEIWPLRSQQRNNKNSKV